MGKRQETEGGRRIWEEGRRRPEKNAFYQKGGGDLIKRTDQEEQLAYKK